MAKVVLVLGLASLHALSALALLMLSSWFIAISAIAPVNFNYMIPAVAVRALALIRIASGYGKLLWGHEQLLEGLAELRNTRFSTLLSQQALFTSQELHHLNDDLEVIAGRWINFVEQQISAVMMLLLSHLIIAWLLPQLYLLWFIFSVLVMGLYVASFILQHKLQAKISKLQLKYERASAEHFNHANIWHLEKGASQSNIEALWQLQQRQSTLANVSVLMLQAISFVMLTWVCWRADLTLMSASFMIVILLLLNAADWLGNGFMSLTAFAQKNHISNPEHEALKPAKSDAITEIELVDFQAEYLADAGINWQLDHAGLYLLKGSSGSSHAIIK